ncbi:hypothetical protein IWW45_007693 [Coemansia sp. RSA 485]|nr:hypothetical protein IWW45_007693 [Coemansia sp. RSA 485]
MRFDPEASKAEAPKAPPARCIGCAKSEYVVFCHSIPGGSQAAQTKACSQRRLSGVVRGANAPVDKQESAPPQRKLIAAQHGTAQPSATAAAGTSVWLETPSSPAPPRRR